MKTLLDLAREKRAEVMAPAEALITAAETESRDLTPAEFDQIKAAKEAAKDLDERIAELTDLHERNAIAAKVLPQVGGAKVTSEARTYSREAHRTEGRSFLADVAAGTLGNDFEARDRLVRHMQEERVERPHLFTRATGTGAFTNLTVPQYLTDMYAPNLKAGRPFANICNTHELPASGMTVEISRITTGSATGIQANQNDAATETDMDDTALSIPVLTLAGRQTVSRQALERSTGVESVTVSDLVRSLNTTVDSTLINQASTGLNAVTDANLDIAYTDASPTAAEAWPKLFDAIQRIQSAMFNGAEANAFVMHPRRFWWFASQVGTNFPFVNLSGAGPQSGGSVSGTGYEQGPSGFLAGLPVYVDANIVTNAGAGTNEDVIYAVSTSECHLWEDDAVFIRAEQTPAANLGVLFVLYKYMAYTFSRYPNANARIAGTGLVTPTF